MFGFDGVLRGNYFRGELVRRTEVEVRVERLRNGKAAVKDEITGEMINGRGGSRDYIIFPLRVMLCLETGDLLSLFHCTRVKRED